MRGFGDYVTDTVGGTLKARDCRDTADLVVVHGRQDPCVSDKAYALDRQGSGNTNVICLASNTIGRQPHNGGNGTGFCANTAYTLTAADRHAVQVGASVRRLTPLECERLQGMPDNHTRIPWRGKTAEDCPDAPRYKAIISMSDAEIDGFCHSKISLCISGKRKTHKGFTWGASVWPCR